MIDFAHLVVVSGASKEVSGCRVSQDSAPINPRSNADMSQPALRVWAQCSPRYAICGGPQLDVTRHADFEATLEYETDGVLNPSYTSCCASELGVALRRD